MCFPSEKEITGYLRSTSVHLVKWQDLPIGDVSRVLRLHELEPMMLNGDSRTNPSQKGVPMFENIDSWVV